MPITALGPYPFTLRQLQYVVAVSQTLSFRRAAERCYVSQPSLSAQLSELEDALGVRLFERDRRRVFPTPAGKELIEQALAVLAEADRLISTAKRAGDPFDGTLRIGVIPTVSPYLLPSAAPVLRAAYPRLTTLWVEDKTESLMRGLDQGTLDAALLALEAELGDAEHETVAVDPFVLAARPTDPLAARTKSVTPTELHNAQVLLLDDGHCFREQALAYCSTTRAKELEFRATSLPTLTQMVAGGAGVTLLPLLAVATEATRAGLRVRRFAAPEPHRTIALVWRKRSPLGPALRALAATLRKAYPNGARARRTRASRR